jgi:hypothetical protein
MSYLLIQGFKIDMKEEIPFPLDFSIADIKDPSKRSRSKSRTITIEGTQNNLSFFYSCYQLSLVTLPDGGVTYNYDATATYIAEYYNDGAMVFRGCFQVISAKINGGVIKFEAVLFDQTINTFQEWGDRFISELGWDEYNHTLSHSVLAASWDAYVVKNGVNTTNFTLGVPQGFGYLYPLVDYGYDDDLNSFKDNDLFPHVYVKEILEKAFNQAGLTIGGSWISAVNTRRLVYGYGGGEKFGIDSATLADREVQVTADLDQTYTYAMANGQNVAVNTKQLQATLSIPLFNSSQVTVTVTTDVDGQFDTSNGIITIANNGTYSLRINGSFDYGVALSAAGTKQVQSSFAIGFILDGLAPVLAIDTGTLLGEVTGTFTFDNTIELPLNAGQQLDVRFFANVNATINPAVAGSFGNLTVDVDFDNDVNFSTEQINAQIVTGETIRLAQFMPQTKIVDFVNGIIKHFNLYISEPTPDGVVRVEPLNDYYLGTNNFDDWTHKIDYSKEFKIEATAITQPKRYAYRFQPDVDFYRRNYLQKFGVHYGDRVVDNGAFFANGTSEVLLPYTVAIPCDSDQNDRIIPRIITYESNTIKPYAGKPKLYLYQGKFSCEDWTLVDTDGGSNTVYNVYPRVHHLNNLATPSLDILFSVPLELNYTATNYTTKNVYQENHDQFIRELISQDGKLVTCYVRINKNDINGEFFRKAKMINGVLYRLNTIKDYNANKDGSVVCELIKITEARSGRTFTNTLERLPLDNYVNSIEFTPIAVPQPSDSGKYRLSIDSSGNLRTTNDAGLTKSAGSGAKYELYAKATQTTTSAPTVTVVKSTFPSAGSFTRFGIGSYRWTNTGNFAGNVIGLVTNGLQDNATSLTFQVEKQNDNVVNLYCYEDGSLSDNILTDASIIIMVF